MRCKHCGKLIKENTDGKWKYCPGHPIGFKGVNGTGMTLEYFLKKTGRIKFSKE